MNPRTLRPANVAAGALVLGGALVVVFPAHVVTVAQIVVVTVAVAVAVQLLASQVPPTGWISPFHWLSPFSARAHARRRAHRSGELALIRRRLSSRRQPVALGPDLPPALLRELQALAEASVEAPHPGARRPGSPLELASAETRAVLSETPLARPRWWRTRAADPVMAAEAVHRVLDDLERLRAGAGAATRADAPSRRSAR